MDNQNYVNNIFSSVSNKYDVMNDIMSFGVHRHWKHKFLDKINDYSSSILDVACGTGDIIYSICQRAKKYQVTPNVTGVDINEEMLEIAKKRMINKNILNTNFIKCDGINLPFPDSSFNYYLISFGIRNIKNINQAVSEAYRVLKPGGCFLCLEFSKVQNAVFNRFYQIYSKFIPTIGGIVTQNKDAYEYLVESIKLFYSQEEFVEVLKSNNFARVSYEELTMGVVSIYKGYKT